MDKYLLGIDIGTTATKLVLIHRSGKIMGSISGTVALYTPKKGWAEENPTEWWDHIITLLPKLLKSTGILPKQISSVGVSGMVPTLIFLDQEGRPLRHSIQQNDARAWEEISELSEKIAGYPVLEETGSSITQQSIAPKIMWLQKNEPHILEKTVSICGSYDYITRCLIGGSKRTIEANWALESGMYNYKSKKWDVTILEAAGIKKEWLGEVYQSHEIVGEIKSDSKVLLIEGTPVVAGTADHVASAFSAGLTQEGDMLIKLGGAGDILVSASQPLSDERIFLDYHLIPDCYLPNGCMASSGSLIRWFQREVANGVSLPDLDHEAEAVRIGSEGLVTLPYFLGEKTPINDPKARGMFFGLHLGHKRSHMYRSILEGIGYGFNHHVKVFKELGIKPNRVRITNGGSRSRLWRQILADITGLTLESIIAHPGSSLGAAFIAGIAVKEFDSWSDIERFIDIEETIKPDKQNHEKYKILYDVYRTVYSKTIQEQHILSDFS